jgi:four helix bundle protein
VYGELEGGEKPRDLKERTKRFSLQVIRCVEKLPNSKANIVLSNQMLRSATSVSANYGAAGVARSKKEFIAKAQIAREEADETQYWAELLCEINSCFSSDLSLVLNEAREFTAILSATIRMARENLT